MQGLCKRRARTEPGPGRPAQPLADRPPAGSPGSELALARHKRTQDDQERRVQGRFDRMDRKAGVTPKPPSRSTQGTRTDPNSGETDTSRASGASVRKAVANRATWRPIGQAMGRPALPRGGSPPNFAWRQVRSVPRRLHRHLVQTAFPSL